MITQWIINFVHHIIDESPMENSPDTDGLTNEFYKKFWPKVKNLLLDSYNETLETGSLLISQKQGIISLIPTANKNTLYLKNWHPITLLNTDYKYMAKSLTDRCREVLPYIVSTDQTGLVPGRVIGTNINKILNMIDYCNDTNTQGVLVSIDFEKAFDSINWEFVFRALKFFDFSETFTNWIKIFYNNIQTCVLNKAHVTKFFSPRKGVRQGCPLSPCLFVSAAEIISLYFKNIPLIKSVMSKRGEYQISQFTDDTSFMLLR